MKTCADIDRIPFKSAERKREWANSKLYELSQKAIDTDLDEDELDELQQLITYFNDTQ